VKFLSALVVVFLFAGLGAACSEKHPEAVPEPRELTSDAVGYFCGMTVLNHNGPKGQIFLTDRKQPLWFTSVRDTLAFLHLPGEPKNIVAIYVTDVGRASWDQPEPGTWIDAREAFYVIGSDRRGGMQSPEVVPFSSREDAERFVQQHGGKIYTFSTVPLNALLENTK